MLVRDNVTQRLQFDLAWLLLFDEQLVKFLIFYASKMSLRYQRMSRKHRWMLSALR